MIVVDTNVMVNFVGIGSRSGEAKALLQSDRVWIAPRILLSELRNVLVGLVRRGSLRKEQAVVMSDLASRVLAGRVSDVPSHQVIDVALECGLTAYDAEFVVLARTMGVRLVTLDGDILERAADVAVALGRS